MFAIQGDSNNGFTIGKLETKEDTKYQTDKVWIVTFVHHIACVSVFTATIFPIMGASKCVFIIYNIL